MSQYGFVYVLRNVSMPHFYKIGATKRSPLKRAAELSSPSGVPLPFEVFACVQVLDPFGVEAMVHETFAECRSSSNREFFVMDSGWLAALISLLKSRGSIRSHCESYKVFQRFQKLTKEQRREAARVLEEVMKHA